MDGQHLVARTFVRQEGDRSLSGFRILRFPFSVSSRPDRATLFSLQFWNREREVETSVMGQLTPSHPHLPQSRLIPPHTESMKSGGGHNLVICIHTFSDKQKIGAQLDLN